MSSFNEGDHESLSREDVLVLAVTDVAVLVKSLGASQGESDRIADQAVDGEALLELTAEHLMKPPYEMRGGPAMKVAKFIKKQSVGTGQSCDTCGGMFADVETHKATHHQGSPPGKRKRSENSEDDEPPSKKAKGSGTPPLQVGKTVVATPGPKSRSSLEGKSASKQPALTDAELGPWALDCPWEEDAWTTKPEVGRILDGASSCLPRKHRSRWKAESSEATTRSLIDLELFGLIRECPGIVVAGEEAMAGEGMDAKSAILDYTIGLPALNAGGPCPKTAFSIEAKKKGSVRTYLDKNLRVFLAEVRAHGQGIFVGRNKFDTRPVFMVLDDSVTSYVCYLKSADGKLCVSQPLTDRVDFVATLLWLVKQVSICSVPDSGDDDGSGGGGNDGSGDDANEGSGGDGGGNGSGGGDVEGGGNGSSGGSAAVTTGGSLGASSANIFYWGSTVEEDSIAKALRYIDFQIKPRAATATYSSQKCASTHASKPKPLGKHNPNI